jgi:hypothetical protein
MRTIRAKDVKGRARQPSVGRGASGQSNHPLLGLHNAVGNGGMLGIGATVPPGIEVKVPRMLSADAVTASQHMRFGESRYHSEASPGRVLLAHPLAHTGVADRISTEATDTVRERAIVRRAPVTHDTPRGMELGESNARPTRMGAVRQSPGNLAIQQRVVAARTDSGAPLGAEARALLPAAFGDVSDLRVHTGPKAAAASAALGTRAFTLGRDLFFAEGAFDVNGAAGRHILLHEVAHGIQQRDAASSHVPSGSVSTKTEVDAERAVATSSAPRLRAATQEIMSFPDQRAASTDNQLFDEYMAGGTEWYERGNYAETFSEKLLVLITTGDIQTVTQVLRKLADDGRVAPAERRAISLHLVNKMRPDQLDELATSVAGRTLLNLISSPLQWGWNVLASLLKVEDAVARAQGHAAAEKTLTQAAQRLEVAAEPEVLRPLDPWDVAGGLIRTRLMLSRLHTLYDADFEIGPALANAEEDLETRFSPKVGGEIDFDDDARQLGATTAIISRFTDALSKFDRMAPAPGTPADADPLSVHFLQIIGGVRRDWIAALDKSVMAEGPNLLAVAESKSAALPEALLQLYLGSVPEHGEHFELLPQSVAHMLDWVGWTQRKIAALRQEADDPPERSAPDMEAREERRRHGAQMIALSVEGIKLWDRAIRAHEALSLGVSLPGHLAPHIVASYASIGRLRQRCEAMMQAALADDLKTLSGLADRNRADPDIEQFFKALPAFVDSANLLPSLVANFLIQFTILKVASLAASAAGALISAGEGASLLNVSAQTGLEALVFTGTARVMHAAIGQQSKDSFLLDLAMNVGLFGMLRFNSAAVSSAMTALGLEAYGGAATQVTSFALLQAHGALQFAISQGHWPNAREIGDMSIDGLIMYGALVGVHRTRLAKPKAHSGLAVLEMLHGEFGERLASVETAKTRLAARIYEQLRAEQAPDPVLQKELHAQAEALESSLTSLLADVKADPQFEERPLRQTLQDPALQSAEVSVGLLAESFGVPAEAGLTSAGEAQYSYAPGATEVVVDALEAKNAVVTDVVDASGQHTLVAEAPGERPIYVSERAAAPEARKPKQVYIRPSVPEPPPGKMRAPYRPKGEVYAPRGGLTDQGVTQVREQQGNRNLSPGQANLKAASDSDVLEHLVKEHFRRAINRGEISGRLVSGHKMNIRAYAEELSQRADAPSLDEATRNFIDRPENERLRNELVNRLVRLRNALRMPAADLPDAAIAGDPWEAAGRLRDKAQAAEAPAALRRAAEDYVSMFARSIGDLQPDMIIIDSGSITVIDATHTVGTQFEVFHEFKTLLYKRIIEQISGLPVTGIEFRSPREQRTL